MSYNRFAIWITVLSKQKTKKH